MERALDKTAKSLGLTALHLPAEEDQVEFLELQVQESRKVIFRHLVELEVAKATRKRAETVTDPDFKQRLKSLADTRELEGSEAIKQVKANLETCNDLLQDLK